MVKVIRNQPEVKATVRLTCKVKKVESSSCGVQAAEEVPRQEQEAKAVERRGSESVVSEQVKAIFKDCEQAIHFNH